MSHGSALTAVLGDAVEREMRALLAELRTSSPLHDLAAYHLGWVGRVSESPALAAPSAAASGPAHAPTAGKKVRPLLTLMITQALAGDLTAALPVAAAIELVHSAALVFDDIQDASPLRRGHPALWQVCGAAQAINVGVTLQAAVHLGVTRAVRAGLAPLLALSIGAELAQCMVRLAEGQYLDLAFQSKSLASIDDYMAICAAKTAPLFGTAAYLGVALAGREDLTSTARRLGHHIGMYLQLEDDIGGIWGSSDRMGKAPSDMQAGKKTLPLLYLSQTEGLSGEAADLLSRYLRSEELTASEMTNLRQYAVDLGGRAYAEEMAAFHRDLARRALGELDRGLADEVGALLEGIAASLMPSV